MKFTITMRDLKAYVAQLAPEDEVGECQDMYGCLVAEAAHWKYPNRTAKVHADNRHVTLDPINSQAASETVDLSPDVTAAAFRFDNWMDTHDSDRPTKAEIEEYMPELFEASTEKRLNF